MLWFLEDCVALCWKRLECSDIEVFKLRLGASIPRRVCRLVCLSVHQSCQRGFQDKRVLGEGAGVGTNGVGQGFKIALISLEEWVEDDY